MSAASNEGRYLLMGIVVAAVIMAGAILLSVANYRECRASGFSVRYCALTHLVR